MPIWERYSGENSLTAPGVHVNRELLYNKSTDEFFESAPIVFVDGILTVITDTDGLMGVRLLVATDLLTTGDLTEDEPGPGDNMVWYTWYAARGPLVFRLRSKKTLQSEHKLWIQTWNAHGPSTTLRYGILLFEQLMH